MYELFANKKKTKKRLSTKDIILIVIFVPIGVVILPFIALGLMKLIAVIMKV